MDTTLQDLIQRLDADKLLCLEALCAEQAKRIQELEEENARLKSAAEDFERTAEMWHDIAFDMTAERDVQIGITQDEEIVVIEGNETALADDTDEPEHHVIRCGADTRYPSAGNFLLDSRLDGYQTADIGCLDAPDFMPAGSHIGITPSGSHYTYTQPSLSFRGGLA